MKLRTSPRIFGRVAVEDRDSLIDSSVYDYSSDRLITIQEPKTVASVNYRQLGCCAMGEVCTFVFEPMKSKKQKNLRNLLLARNLMKALKQENYSFVHIAFVKMGKDKQYQQEAFMKTLMKLGWKEVGPEFENRRYDDEGTTKHHIKVLCYLFQTKKKGNQL